ncbi:MAG TPA: IPT/TIG domain-containing protein [Ferruginibacter sp.]|jgi:hypothetical protein|nr:IPT/TIG domain-containing protein [Ferruginibacter sp.]
MKQFKNLTLAVMGGLLVLTMATMSCSKHNSSAPVPTVTGATPTTASVGDTLTVTGTGFTSGSTATINGTAATVIFVSSTEIKVVVLSGSTTGALLASNGGSIGTQGTNVTIVAGITSNSVASSNLLAHWTFDTNSAEVGSGDVASTVSGVTFTSAGKIGNCATFTNGYLLYNPIPQINVDTALESYSISMWVNISTADNTTGVLRSLFQITGNKFPDIWGQVDLELVNNGVGTDSLPLSARQDQVDGTGPHLVSTGANVPAATGAWTFLTETYNGNGTNQTIELYANGNRIDSTQWNDVTKPGGSQTTFRIVPTGNYPTDGIVPNNKVYIGSLSFFDRGNSAGDGYGNFAPTWSAGSYPWAAESFTGQMDDIRLFNTAITAAQVDSLYTLGSAGK